MSFKDKILNNQSPWGAPPGGDGGRGSPGGNGSGSRQDPPSLDDVIKNFQKTINKFSGGKSGGSRPIIIGLIIIALLYVASGLYRVLPDEQGVVLRFGKFVNTTQPGLNYHFPYPIESVITPKVTKVNRMDIGFRSERDSGFTSGGVADVPEESLMLTGDENIVNIDFSVFWVIKDAGNFLFKIQDPEGTVKAAAETAMREVIARSDIQPILTEGRSVIETETQQIIQKILVKNIIVPFRSKKTQEAYSSIWEKEGSPLIINTNSLAKKISEKTNYSVEIAMRYQHPSIKHAIEKLINKGCNEIIAVPLYPHYAQSTILTTENKIKEISNALTISLSGTLLNIILKKFSEKDKFLLGEIILLPFLALK